MIFRKKNFFTLAFLAFVSCSSLSAEVQQVTLIWQPGLCNTKCVELLNKQIAKINGVASVAIDQGQGRAVIVWKNNVPFSFQPLNAAARYVGIRVNDIRLKVQGKLQPYGTQYKLISAGDNTNFILLNPLVPQPRTQVVAYNPSVRQLSPELAATLLDLSKRKQTVTIEGQFYEPYRSPPNYLVVENITQAAQAAPATAKAPSSSSTATPTGTKGYSPTPTIPAGRSYSPAPTVPTNTR